MDAVGAVDVRVPGRAEHRRVALGAARGTRARPDPRGRTPRPRRSGRRRRRRAASRRSARARRSWTERRSTSRPSSLARPPGVVADERRQRERDDGRCRRRRGSRRRRSRSARSSATRRARLDVAELRRARHLGELDAGQPAAQVVGRRGEQDRVAQDRADEVGGAGGGEKHEREPEGCSRSPNAAIAAPQSAGRDADADALAADVAAPSPRRARRASAPVVRARRRGTPPSRRRRRAPPRRRGTARSACRRPSRSRRRRRWRAAPCAS